MLFDGWIRVGIAGLLTAALVGCTAAGAGLEGSTFGSGALPNADDDDTDGGEDTDSAQGQVSAGSDSDDDPTGDDPTGDDPTGDDPTGDDPTGDDPTGDDPTGDDTAGETECDPGDTMSCYGGPPATEGVGTCEAGTQTCLAGGTWGACEGDVQPAAETCDNGLDEDCNGSADDGCTTAAACSPMDPSSDCNASEHCVPSTSGDTSCVGPAGLGTQYDTCDTDGDCAPGHVCVDTGQGTVYCMQWCTNTLDCPLLFDSCNGLEPAVFAGPSEHGVCYDGLP